MLFINVVYLRIVLRILLLHKSWNIVWQKYLFRDGSAANAGPRGGAGGGRGRAAGAAGLWGRGGRLDLELQGR